MRWYLLFAAMSAEALYAGAIYDVVNLGSLGGSSVAATAISSTGQAVGWAMDPFNNMHAVSFSAGGVVDLASDAMATGVNAAGQIVGVQYFNGTPRAIVWQDGTAHVVGAPGSFGMAINAAGEVAGLSGSTAFAGPADLGLLPSGDWTSAYGLNNAGEAAGYGFVGNGSFRAFTWSQGGGFTVLGTLGGKSSYAMAINDAGQVAGHAQVSSGYLHAFVSHGTSLQDLGTLGGGSSYAYGIDSAGDVVGYSWTLAGSTDAFLFRNGVMLDLNSLIDPASGWVLTKAFGINDAGQIVGTGYYKGAAAAFRLDRIGTDVVQALSLDDPQFFTAVDPSPVPELSSMWLCGIGLIGLGLIPTRSLCRKAAKCPSPRSRESGRRES